MTRIVPTLRRCAAETAETDDLHKSARLNTVRSQWPIREMGAELGQADSRPFPRNIVSMMIKKLQKHGNSHALVIDKALMEALGIDENTPLQVTVSGTTLVVSPVEVGIGDEDVRDAIAKLRPKYARMLKRLAE